MRSIVAVTLGALLLVLVLRAVGGVALIETRTRRVAGRPVYVINDAIDFTVGIIDREVLERVRPAGVRRIIEWSTHYLQGLAVPARRRMGLRVVAGGEGNAIDYIHSELSKRGHEYSPSDIAAVLAGEAGYLAEIGALGEQVDEEEPV